MVLTILSSFDNLLSGKKGSEVALTVTDYRAMLLRAQLIDLCSTWKQSDKNM